MDDEELYVPDDVLEEDTDDFLLGENTLQLFTKEYSGANPARPSLFKCTGFHQEQTNYGGVSHDTRFIHISHFPTSDINQGERCSLDKSSLGRCFKSRHSNESQCPMLSNKAPVKQASKEKQQKSSLLASMKTSPNANASNQKKLRFQLAKERKASTTLGIIMSAFTICWLPFFVLALARPFLDTTNALKTLGSLFLWLGYANSLFNPIIYATLNRDFRKPFQAILYFRCGSLNHMMREEFYHSQYGDPDHHVSARCHVDYEEGVEYIEAEGDEVKTPEINTAHDRSSGEYYEIRGLESDGRASLREFFRGLKPQGLILHQKITFVTRGRGVNGDPLVNYFDTNPDRISCNIKTIYRSLPRMLFHFHPQASKKIWSLTCSGHDNSRLKFDAGPR
ncbi:hypothetical protein GEV33_007589 [Tenebrio molitor]|uniref:G-protein coupled receptors family 1 profile domain-containing protein n=1 Tax=Tenebrio molitor TaxID=7067 RepID=A0A8J6HJF8_TENMO|nr:hypothetical protein GEV33_007589 [Tenebrio molitor]